MPTIDLPDDELAALVAAVRRAIEGDRYPRAPRLDALKAALGRLEAAGGRPSENSSRAGKSSPHPKAAPGVRTDLEPATGTGNRLTRKAPPPAKADKRAKGSKATAAKAPAPKISPGFKLGRLPPDR